MKFVFSHSRDSDMTAMTGTMKQQEQDRSGIAFLEPADSRPERRGPRID